MQAKPLKEQYASISSKHFTLELQDYLSIKNK